MLLLFFLKKNKEIGEHFSKSIVRIAHPLALGHIYNRIWNLTWTRHVPALAEIFMLSLHMGWMCRDPIRPCV